MKHCIRQTDRQTGHGRGGTDIRKTWLERLKNVERKRGREKARAREGLREGGKDKERCLVI